MRAHFLLCLHLCLSIGAQTSNVPVNVSVGLIMDSGFENLVSAVSLAINDFYSKNNGYYTRLALHHKNAISDVVDAGTAALDLIGKKGVQAILGPLTSQQAYFVAELGGRAHVPIISFTATNPSLTSSRNPYFLRATQNDATQTGALASIMKAFQWREAAVIYDDDEFGMGILSYLSDALLEVNARISLRSAIPANAPDNQIRTELYRIMNLETRVIIVHMIPNTYSATRVFKFAKEQGLMREGYVWLLSDGAMNLLDSVNQSVIDSLHGALGVKTYIESTVALEDFKGRLTTKLRQEHPNNRDAAVDVFALWAYDAIFALGTAIEVMGSEKFSNMDSSPTKQIPESAHGEGLLRKLKNVNFTGLAGNFRFVDGQLPEATYSIVNVGNERNVGYWRRGKGLSQDLNSSENGTSPANLSPIRWMGDTKFPPTGWGIPGSANKRKLKVGVPKNTKYSEFVTVVGGNKSLGFCIDLFEELLKTLPYYLEADYIPFEGDYNELVYRVASNEFDAAVGDITIQANRSKYVDFTLPFTDSAVFIVTNATIRKSGDAFLFVRPMSMQLWVTIISFFIGLAFFVWLLEHRVNKNFRGPPSNQVGTSLLFSFSTMVFAHRERVNSNLTRLVVIAWCFLILVVAQSYTASLTSLLTVEVAQSNDIDIDKLLVDRSTIVGYKEKSFLLGMLQQFGFQEANLKSYETYEEGRTFLQNGTIQALFIEEPYLRTFLNGNCSYYSTKQSFQTGGFGFAFPHGSPLVADISRAILTVATNLYNVTKYDTMTLMERKWFPLGKLCDTDSTNLKSSQLELKSFWVLFAFVGAVSLLAVAIFALDFYLENRELLKSSEHNGTFLKKAVMLCRMYDRPAFTRYPFRTSARSPTTSHNSSPFA